MMARQDVMLEFETINGRKLMVKRDAILEVFEGADGNAGIVLNLLDKPTVWLREPYKKVSEKVKDAE